MTDGQTPALFTRRLTPDEVKTMRKNDPEQVAKYLRLKVIEFSPPVTNPVNPVKLPEEPLYLNGAYDAYADLYGKMLAGYFTKAV